MGYNACRTPWRLAHYYALTHDARLLDLLRRQHASLCTPSTKAGQKYPEVPAGIAIADGKPLVSYTDRAFIAPAAYLAHVVGDSSGQSRGLAQLNNEDASYFGASREQRPADRAGDAIDLVIAVQATSLATWA